LVLPKLLARSQQPGQRRPRYRHLRASLPIRLDIGRSPDSTGVLPAALSLPIWDEYLVAVIDDAAA
jgi:hypothetical protein